MGQNDGSKYANNVFYAYQEGTGNNYTFLCRNDRQLQFANNFLGSGNTYWQSYKIQNGKFTSTIQVQITD